MAKIITRAEDAKEQILKAVDTICDPVKQTLTPKGGNVLFTVDGEVAYSNDGITIADAVTVDEPLEQAIIDVMKQASRATNNIVGDGTTTTLIFAQALIREGMKLIDDGLNPMVLKKQFLIALPLLLKELDSLALKIDSSKDLEHVANVSSNNDPDITKNVVEAIEAAGEDGLIFLEDNPSSETKIKKHQGYFMDAGMYSPLLANTPKMEASYKDVKVLVTDKRIYHGKEAIAIMTPIMDAGFKDLVIVAKDFIGQAPNVFITNHQKGVIRVLLVKDTEVTDMSTESLEDLASYLGANFISEKKGSKTFDVSLKDFGTAEKVISTSKQTIFYGETKPVAKHRIAVLRSSLKDTDDEKEKELLKKRIARMTRGAITISVGGATPTETREKIYHYEDAVNATRSANKSGYVVGGGISPYLAYKNATLTPKWAKNVQPDVARVLSHVIEAPLKQVAINCNLHLPTLLENVDNNKGYNAVTEKYGDLMKDGIIEPLDVPKLSLTNAISVANIILTSRYLMIDKKDEEKK